jgi:hypothetical protein
MASAFVSSPKANLIRSDDGWMTQFGPSGPTI